MNTATATVQTFTYRAKGFTEDINQCEVCGKPELKGTVRMVVMDSDGGECDEFYAGVTCAAKRAGRKAGEIRHEAKTADEERRAAYSRWMQDQSSVVCKIRDEILASQGLSIRQGRIPFAVISAALDEAEASSEMQAWAAANPNPGC